MLLAGYEQDVLQTGTSCWAHQQILSRVQWVIKNGKKRWQVISRGFFPVDGQLYMKLSWPCFP